jgi:hypothetical protein
MSVKKRDSRERKARRWAARLLNCVRAVLAVRPEADPDNVRHTLILLEQSPLKRLTRRLTGPIVTINTAAFPEPVAEFLVAH